MKRIPWLCLLLLAVAGCSSAPDPAGRSERDFFTAAASRLDPEGSFYFIANFSNLRRAVGEWLRRSQIAVAEAEGPAERREKLQLAASGGELVLRLLGADFLAGVGASSVRIAPADESGEAIFRNRLFFVSREGRTGPLWESGGSPAPRLAWLDILPADTWLAASAPVDPVRIFTALNRNREAADSLDRLCRIFTGSSAPELLAGFAGEWQLAVGGDPDAPEGSSTGVRAVLVIPDRESRLFNRLKLMGKTDETGDRLTIAVPADGVAPVLLRRPDLLVFCSSPAAEPLGVFLADSRAGGEGPRPAPPWKVSLGGQSRFRRFAAGLPAETDTVFFCQDPGGEKTSRIRIAGVNMPLGDGRNTMVLSVAQLFDDGWLVTSHSSTDLNEDIFFESVVFPALAAARVVADRIAENRGPAVVRKPAPADEEKNGDTPPPADPPAEVEQCAAAIAKAGAEVLSGGAVPADFRRFTVATAAGSDSAAKPPSEFPLLLDRPDRHRGGFHVFYRSGKTEWIPLERPGSCRRMIGALQSLHHYPEAIFVELIRQAAEFDRAAETKTAPEAEPKIAPEAKPKTAPEAKPKTAPEK